VSRVVTQKITQIGVVNGLVPWIPLLVGLSVALNICSFIVREEIGQVRDIGPEDLS
jgi:hypothetical protein